MKKLFTPLCIIAVLAVALASIAPVDFYATLRGMQSVAREAPGTFAYGNGQLSVLFWQQKGGYAFAVVHQNGSILKDLSQFVNANQVSTWTASDFVSWLEGNGYQRIDPRALPFGSVLLSQAVSLMATGARAFTTVFFIPVGALQLDTLNPYSQQVLQ